jgi:hypothetical protein
MIERIDSCIDLVASVPITFAQDNTLPQLFKNREIDTAILINFLLIIGVISIVTSVGMVFYSRWKKFKEFETEMKTLDLEPEIEETLANMVKRYSKNEPVKVLFSSRTFDEIASNEIKRVLASPVSAEIKGEYIDRIYQIRTKTYNPDLLESNSQRKKKRNRTKYS